MSDELLKSNTVRRLGVIKNPVFGCRDDGVAALSFHVYMSEALVLVQSLTGVDLAHWVEESRVSNVRDLDGTACWMTSSDPLYEDGDIGPSMIFKFAGFFRP